MRFVLTTIKNLVNWTRVKAYLWYGLGQAIALILAQIGANLEAFNLPTWAIVAIGLLISQITKAINQSFEELDVR